MEGVEELVLLIGMGAEQALLALVQLDLGCLNGSSHAPLLCDQGGNFSMHIMISLELSCNSPVFLGLGVIVHGSVHGVICEAFKKPMREFSLLIDGDTLREKEFMPVDGLIDTDSTQAVEPVQFDIGGKDMHGVVTIRNWDEKVKDVSFVFLISLRCLSSPLPFRIPLVGIFGPVLVGFFQASCMHLVLCQIFTLLFEGLELFLIVAADLLIFSCNSHQSLRDEEEFLPTWCPVSFESGTH